MFQQIVADPIRCMGLSLHDWSPQISQSEGFVVDFGVVGDEVNFDLLLLYGLECSTVVGRGGVVCEYCCVFVSNIFWVGDGSTILSIQILLGRADVFERYFPHSIPPMLYRSFSWQLWYILFPWLAFLLVEESPSLRLWPSESRYGFPSQCSTVSNSLAQGLPNLQGFLAFFIKPWVWFLGDGGCPWDADIWVLGYVLDKGV